MQVRSYGYDHNDPNCSGLANEHQNPDGSPNWGNIGQTFRDLQTQLSKDLFMDFYNNLPTQAAKDFYHCGNGGTKTYTGVWGSCAEYDICYNPEGWSTIDIRDCGDPLCCLQVSEICMGPGGVPIVTESFVSNPADCGTPSLSGSWPCFTWGCVPVCDEEVAKSSARTSPIEAQHATVYNLNVAPNPFHDAAEISYTLRDQANVEIVLFDAFGRQVMTLYNGRQSKGAHTVKVSANDLVSGSYTFQLRIGEEVHTGSVILAR